MSKLFHALALSALLGLLSPVAARGKWEAEVMPVTLQVGYAVRTADLSGDGKLDIVIVDSKRILWLENPTWKVHEIYSTPSAPFDNVCIAIKDIDGDGRLDMALGSDWQFGNSDSGGHIGLLFSPEDPRNPWTYRQIATEPTAHRMAWADLDGNGKQELIVAPLKGRGSRPPELTQTGVRLLSFSIPAKPREANWESETLTDALHVMHNVDVIDMNRDGKDEIVAASFEGLTVVQLDNSGKISLKAIGSGQTGMAPAIGSSEVRVWQSDHKLPKFAATIEPWHGDKVVVYTEDASGANTDLSRLWTRTEVDKELKWGHAVAWGQLDDDPAPELVAGIRDDLDGSARCGVRIYDWQEGKWKRSLIEPGQVAVEDIAVSDFDGDGKPDIIAVGRATHNAVIYWNR
jgi:hypothetical protein